MIQIIGAFGMGDFGVIMVRCCLFEHTQQILHGICMASRLVVSQLDFRMCVVACVLPRIVRCTKHLPFAVCLTSVQSLPSLLFWNERQRGPVSGTLWSCPHSHLGCWFLFVPRATIGVAPLLVTPVAPPWKTLDMCCLFEQAQQTLHGIYEFGAPIVRFCDLSKRGLIRVMHRLVGDTQHRP